jgi:hypothetical protein
MTIYEEKERVGKAIELFGGGFIQALKGAMDYADHINLQKIKNTWPDEWEQYLELYEKAKEKGIV